MKALRSPLVLVGATVLVVLIAVAVLAPLIAPFDPKAAAGPSLDRPSGRHLLGTDDIGQDIFSSLVWGARQSLVVGLGAATLAIATGLLVGVLAGVVGGAVDTLAMRLVDVALALPRLPLLVIIAALGAVNRTVLVLVIGLITWPETARIVRTQPWRFGLGASWTPPGGSAEAWSTWPAVTSSLHLRPSWWRASSRPPARQC